MKPPNQLDGATVVLWAWSSDRPFFEMPYSDGSGGIPIHGLAVCRYDESEAVYRFSCDSHWDVQNDTDHKSIDDARTCPSAQYDVERVKWQTWVPDDGTS